MARAASGMSRSVMNSRRLMCSPRSEDHPLPYRRRNAGFVHHSKIDRQLQRWVIFVELSRVRRRRHVRFAPIASSSRHGGNRAHALMSLGREDEARAIYLRYSGEKVE